MENKENFEFAEKKKLDKEDDKSEYEDIRIETNLSKLELNKDAIKGVYLFGCDIEEENQIAQEINKVNIMRKARKIKCFQEEIKKYVPDYYISGLILMGKPIDDSKKIEFYLKIKEEKDGKTKGKIIYDKKEFSDKEKVYKFTFKRKKKGLSKMAEKEDINKSGEAQCIANYLNICLGKLLKKCKYTKDRTSRKILYYNKDDAIKPKKLTNQNLLFFPALKAVCETYENNRIYMKLLPKKLLKTKYTYEEYFYSIRKGSLEETLEEFKRNVLNKKAIKIYDQAMIKIEDVEFKNPYEIYFNDKNNKKISVGDYYDKVLQKKLPKEEIPIAVRIIDKGGKLKGDDRLKIHIPCSQLEIIGNFFGDKINAKELVQKPTEKYIEIDDIRYLLEENAKTTDEKELHNYLGDKFDPVTVDGQIIKPPLIKFDKGTNVEVQNGNFNLINTSPYSDIKELNKIDIFLIDLNEEEGGNIWGFLEDAKKELGIKFKSEPKFYHLNSCKNKKDFESSVRNYLKEFDEEYSDKKTSVDFIFMFMDSWKKNSFHYMVFKSVVNEFNWVIPTQVILYNREKNKEKNNFFKNSVLSQFTNILCQMWAKKGNELYICDFSFVPKTMVVAYSSMAVQNNQILTSISVSIGTKLYEYAFYSKLEENSSKGARISPSIKSLLSKALSTIGKHLTKKVENIVIYRDALNERQQYAIKDTELNSIKNAIIEVNNKLKEKIFENTKWCLILVSKINEIKMFLRDKYKGNNDTIIENIPVGTLVDSKITNKDKYDFYLNSADSRQGTCSPTHYTVLYDDTELTAIQIYKLTYYLTYLSYNTTRSIRVPAPLYFVTRRNKFTYENLQGKLINSKLRTLNISL